MIDTLNKAVNATLADAAVKARLTGMDMLAMGGTPAAFKAFVAHETAK